GLFMMVQDQSLVRLISRRDNAVYWVEIYPGVTPVYFAATSTGLFSTEILDGSNTIWSLEGGDIIGNCIINMVDVRPYDGKIVVGTHGRGIFSSSMEPVEAAGIENSEFSSNEVQIYPNPFHDRITIQCNLESAGDVALEVYDTFGKRVFIERRFNLPQGKQQIVWKPLADLPCGAYIYKVVMSEKTYTGKLLYQ
ncbi:MAG: T9SS type A sorting domain-containing protein, partial [Flavobacteriales bacterium]